MADHTVDKFKCGKCLEKELRRHRVKIVHGPSSRFSQRLWKCCKSFASLRSQSLSKCQDTGFCVQPKIKNGRLKEALTVRKKAYNSVDVALSKKSALHLGTTLEKARSYPREFAAKPRQGAL